MVFSLNSLFISKTKNVFLSIEQTKLLLWTLTIIYLIKIFISKEKRLPKEQINNEVNEKEEYIIVQYAKLKSKYYNYIKTKYNRLIPIIYAIMIYENKNTTEFERKINYYKYKINGKPNKFGIMQIYSRSYITDENSISIAIKKLEKIYYQLSIKKEINDINIIKKYYKNESTKNEVLLILNEIKKFNQK